MNNSQPLTEEQASRLAVTATVADLEHWACNVAVDGRIHLDELLPMLDVLRAASIPHHTAPAIVPALSAS